MDALKKQRDELEKELNAWTGVANIYNPEMDVEKLPRLLIESIEVEGPIQKEWPPAEPQGAVLRRRRAAGRRLRPRDLRPLPAARLSPAGDEGGDRRDRRRREGRPDHRQALVPRRDAGRACSACSAAPGFLFLRGARRRRAAAAGRSPTTNWRRGCRTSCGARCRTRSCSPWRPPASCASRPSSPRRSSACSPTRRRSNSCRTSPASGCRCASTARCSRPPSTRTTTRPLEQASKQEPYAFFAEVLTKNLPITSFLDSDFVVVNERLAKHYGIEGVEGPEFRRVAIRPEHHRGGVLGMAGLMTLPGRRHADAADAPRLVGAARAVQRSAQQSAAQRRRDPAQHRRQEPDRPPAARAAPPRRRSAPRATPSSIPTAWRWRTTTPSANGASAFNGEGFRGRNAPLLDVSGTFPDGTKFATLEEYKAGLMTQKDKFARAFSVEDADLCPRPAGRLHGPRRSSMR